MCPAIEVMLVCPDCVLNIGLCMHTGCFESLFADLFWNDMSFVYPGIQALDFIESTHLFSCQDAKQAEQYGRT